MKIDAKTPDAYLDAVPSDRRPHLAKLRALINKTLPAAKEGIAWSMIAWTINDRPFAALASQKNYLTLHLMDLYTQPGLREKHAKALASLDIGKGCINFRSADELPLDTIAEIVAAAPGFQVNRGTMAARKKATTAKRKPATKKKAAPKKK